MKNIYEKVLEFRDQRDWKKYHNGKDLAISISLEANELLRIFSGKVVKKQSMIQKKTLKKKWPIY